MAEGERSEPVKCDECGTPVAEVNGEVLIIRRKHHGEPHVTILDLRKLLERRAEEKRPAKTD